MIEFEVEPRFNIGAKVWLAEENEETKKIYAKKAVILGYRVIGSIRNEYYEWDCYYWIVKANEEHPEVNVHNFPEDYEFSNEALFEELIVEQKTLYNSEAEVPGQILN